MSKTDAELTPRPPSRGGSAIQKAETSEIAPSGVAGSIRGCNGFEARESKILCHLKGLQYPAELTIPDDDLAVDQLLKTHIGHRLSDGSPNSDGGFSVLITGFDPRVLQFRALPAISVSGLETTRRVVPIEDVRKLRTAFPVSRIQKHNGVRVGRIGGLPGFQTVIVGHRRKRAGADLKRLKIDLDQQVVKVYLIDHMRKQLHAEPVEVPRPGTQGRKSEMARKKRFERIIGYLHQYAAGGREGTRAFDFQVPELRPKLGDTLHKQEDKARDTERAFAWGDLCDIALDETAPERFPFDPLPRMLEIFDEAWLTEHDRDALLWVSDAMTRLRKMDRMEMGIELAQGLRVALVRADRFLSEIALLVAIADETEKAGSMVQARSYYLAALESAARFGQKAIIRRILRQLRTCHPEFVQGLDTERFEQVA